MKLNLGCGNKKLPESEGWVNVDIARASEPDFCFDIGDTDWPWDNETVDEISASHVMEHLSGDGFLFVMREAYRVMKPGALLTIEVPHPRSDYFIGDPTHRTPIDQNVLNLFSRKLNDEGIKLGLSNTPLAIYLDVDFDMKAYEVHLNPRWQPVLMETDNVTIRNKEYFDHACATFNNVIDNLKFVLERQ